MEVFKIEEFQRNYPTETFPWFRHLGAGEALQIHRQLCALTGLPGNADGFSLVQQMEQAGRLLASENFDIASFDIAKVLEANGVAARPLVFINWYVFDDVDEMRFQDVAKRFDDIWLTMAEDPDIFDSSLNWMLSIRHYNAFVLRRLGSVQGPSS